MNNLLKFSIAAGAALLISGCAPHNYQSGPSSYSDAPLSDIQVINVTGYGAPKSTFDNLAQRRLMALRASEVDAYRKIAEQIAGLQIIGDTRTDDFIADRDRLRTYLNSFVQGATITDQEFESDGMAVTTMSLKISRSEMRRMLEEERYRKARGDSLPQGGAYSQPSAFAPRY